MELKKVPKNRRNRIHNPVRTLGFIKKYKKMSIKIDIYKRADERRFDLWQKFGKVVSRKVEFKQSEM